VLELSPIERLLSVDLVSFEPSRFAQDIPDIAQFQS
jgi:hypothetical protein